jgi:polyferredoxin
LITLANLQITLDKKDKNKLEKKKYNKNSKNKKQKKKERNQILWITTLIHVAMVLGKQWFFQICFC